MDLCVHSSPTAIRTIPVPHHISHPLGRRVEGSRAPLAFLLQRLFGLAVEAEEVDVATLCRGNDLRP